MSRCERCRTRKRAPARKDGPLSRYCRDCLRDVKHEMRESGRLTPRPEDPPQYCDPRGHGSRKTLPGWPTEPPPEEAIELIIGTRFRL